MTDADYVAELRSHGMLSTNKAADHIEALTADNARLQAQIDAAVAAERERCAKVASARADYLEDAIKFGGSKKLIASLKGGVLELRHIAAAIRKGASHDR